MHFLILLAADPSKKNLADVLTPIASGLALILSSSAFIFTVFIQLKERKRNIRQTLSTALSEIAKINVDVSLLKKDQKEITPELLLVRKNYNSQRGTLVSDADFLIKENEKLVTDADCELMALTYDDLGGITKAEEYWLRAIDLAQNDTQKHLHQRDYASFLFNQNQAEKGRKLFEQSLDVEMSKTDDDVSYIADTYLLWAGLENNFGNKKEYERLIKQAYDQCEKIRHKGKNVAMSKLIDMYIHPEHKAGA
jgi:tetratricopeptide (TPR) repeat protein